MKFNIEVELDWLEEGGSLDDEIRSEIVSAASRKVIEIVNGKVEEVGQEAVESAHKQVDKLIADYLCGFTEREIVLTDRWGKVEKTATIEQLIKDRIDAAFSQTVNSRGEICGDSYSNKTTMVEFITKQHAEQKIREEFAIIRKQMDKSIEDAIRTQAKSMLSSALLDQIDLSKIIEAAKAPAQE